MGSRNLSSDLADGFSDPPTRVAYHSGRWVSSDALALPVTDPSITQGVMAVERLRAYHGHLFQVDRHLDRWDRTLAALFIQGTPDRVQLTRLFGELIRHNQAWLQSQDQYGVVLLASPGSADQPSFVIDLYPISASMVSERIMKGSPVVITPVEQPANECWSRNIKVRCRLHYYLADHMAREISPDAIGILVDSDGTVTESSVANVLIVEGGAVISPQRTQILGGISLQVVRELAESLGIPYREERILPERIRTADEVLLTGTSCGLWFANSIDQGPARAAGPIYQQLRMAFQNLVDAAC